MRLSRDKPIRSEVPQITASPGDRLPREDHKATPKAATPTAGTSWQAIADYPTAIQDNLAEYYGGKLYSGFGYNGSVDADTLYSYDPTPDTWTELADMPTGMWGSAYTAANGELLIQDGVAGGVLSRRPGPPCGSTPGPLHSPCTPTPTLIPTAVTRSGSTCVTTR